MPLSPPYRMPSQGHRDRFNRSRLREDDSLDDTIELLTGFTPQQLESINQLVSARVDNIIEQQQQQTPPLTPTHGNLAARRALKQQQSLINLSSAASLRRFEDPKPPPNNDEDRPLPQLPLRTKTSLPDLPSNNHGPPATMGFCRPSKIQLDENHDSPTNATPPPPNVPPPSPMSPNADRHQNDRQTHPALRSVLKRTGPPNGIDTIDFQPPTPTLLPPSPSRSLVPPRPPLSRPSTYRKDSGGLVLQHEVHYLSLHPHLPPSAPLSNPHIVDEATVSYTWAQTGLGFADLVVTILYKYDPHVLSLFLNAGKKHFEFRRRTPGLSTKMVFITREVKFVTVSLPLPFHHLCSQRANQII